ncbi:MAG TPA: hypothetical protein VMG81_08135 [Thermoplasmata archaeon]|nr:hypothetical protein [Thermoplasmata archaeon]
MSAPAPRPSRAPGSRRSIGEYFPWPLVGVTVLLVVLILLTPVLLAPTGPPAAGTIFTQGELLVDRVTGGNATYIYVHAYGPTVRYASIQVTWASDFNWSGAGAPAWNALNWSVGLNASNVLVGVLNTAENPLAINVTALYNENGVAYYVGVFALYLTNATASPPNSLLAVTATSGVSVPSVTAIANLPIIVTLSDVGSTAP